MKITTAIDEILLTEFSPFFFLHLLFSLRDKDVKQFYDSSA